MQSALGCLRMEPAIDCAPGLTSFQQLCSGTGPACQEYSVGNSQQEQSVAVRGERFDLRLISNKVWMQYVYPSDSHNR